MIRKFKVDGAIFERMMFCETWGFEQYSLTNDFKEWDIPLLCMDREYILSGVGQLRTRIQAFPGDDGEVGNGRKEGKKPLQDQGRDRRFTSPSPSSWRWSRGRWDTCSFRSCKNILEQHSKTIECVENDLPFLASQFTNPVEILTAMDVHWYFHVQQLFCRQRPGRGTAPRGRPGWADQLQVQRIAAP